ncbi:MAG: 1-acyl-sn-glycerol-3-phosphate acyltransferase [Romboutsia sp.]|nr:1-acyl-sn-glycerol-3-phosphate acyltransferase [Romboutsia sp.]
MFNYLKFATYQILGFSASIPKLNKIKKNPNNFTNIEIYDFLHHQAKNSLKKVNINLNIKGKNNIPNIPVLYICNHASMLDSFILFTSVDEPIGCVVADEPVWRSMPIVSDWAKLTKCVYINREENREGIKSINEAANNILNGQSMAIFPEGDLTWVKDPNAVISDFRNGALKIAYKAKCPIVPLVIKNSKGTYEGFQPIGKINSKNVEVEFLPPIYDHIENPKLKTVELGNYIRNKMIESINEFNKNQ